MERSGVVWTRKSLTADERRLGILHFSCFKHLSTNRCQMPDQLRRAEQTSDPQEPPAFPEPHFSVCLKKFNKKIQTPTQPQEWRCSRAGTITHLRACWPSHSLSRCQITNKRIELVSAAAVLSGDEQRRGAAGLTSLNPPVLKGRTDSRNRRGGGGWGSS